MHLNTKHLHRCAQTDILLSEPVPHLINMCLAWFTITHWQTVTYTHVYTCAFMKNPNVKANRCLTDSEKLRQLRRNKEWLKILLKNDNSSVTPSINCCKTLHSSSYGKTAKHNMQALWVSKVEWMSFDLKIAQLNENNMTSLVLSKLLIKEGIDS